jgi:hypothetical protein
MPGVTVDMFNWWFAWHGLESLRYKIWWPDGHFSISVSDIDRKKILDPNYSMHDKIWGRTHYVIEDIGGGPEHIVISFAHPDKELGFDVSRFDLKTMTICGGNGVNIAVNAAPDAHKGASFMCHVVREIPGGIELRTRFWMGYKILGKVPYKILPPGIKLPEFVPQGLAVHNVFEFNNLASFLPQIYEEQKEIIA